jgi:hypothetical protein
MNTKKTVFSRMAKAMPKKQVKLGLVDEFNYELEYLEEEVGRLSYSVEEWYPEKFEEWYRIGREIYSVYFQNSESFISEPDVAGDSEILEQIKIKAEELGLSVEEVYPDYQLHKDTLEYLEQLESKFEDQKAEFYNESKSV